MTKCPKCEKILAHFFLETLDGVAGTNRWKCISHNCPHCYTSLGVQIDPIAIKTDILKEMKRQ